MCAGVGFWLCYADTQLSICALQMRGAVNDWDLSAQFLMQFIQNTVECRGIEGALYPGDREIKYFYK